MFEKLGLYYRTIKHLKPIQIRYRLWYILREKFRNLIGHSYQLSTTKKGFPLNLADDCPSSSVCRLPSKDFTFLNQTHTFEGAIDWNFSKYGKLWAYNLNYFDYLNHESITKEEGLKLIREFINEIEGNNEGLEPYPISLRGINWIKFLSKYEVSDEELDSCLYAQYQILADNIEYHLMGNHLLENGCSLLFGAYYFHDEELYQKATRIIHEEIQEQVLNDGGHFERTTMYHCILLERFLDCYNLVANNNIFDDTKLVQRLNEKVSSMLGWLDQLSIKGQLPLLNDAAVGVAPNSSELFDYAERLDLGKQETTLSQSGYRKFSAGHFDIICDIGNIGPDYIPGHAHSDTLSFVLYYQGNPIIIDPGISTYENNERRQLERSTGFHNTVQLDNLEQSEIWSAFRVGRRAKIKDIEEEIIDGEHTHLKASHNGYEKWGITHERNWKIDDLNQEIEITDKIKGSTNKQAYFNLHFHPQYLKDIEVESTCLRILDLNISFRNAGRTNKQIYDCPDGYNQYIQAPKVVVEFTKVLTTKITINS